LAERGILLLDRLTAVARLPAAGVKELKVQQALKNSCRVGAMVALSLTRHLLPTPQGGLLMMFKANRRGSARIKKSWSVLFAPRTLHKSVSATPRAKTGGGFLRCCRGWYELLSDSGCEE
jgi:hypothetical protein